LSTDIYEGTLPTKGLKLKKKLKVLIVEDEKLIARCLSEELKDLDLNPLEPVSKGEIAVTVALKEKPDLILMDIRLAGAMDGIEAAVQIHNNKKIPIIFMSGFSTEYIIEKAHVVEYLEFLEKPVTIDILKPIIDKHY